MDNDKKQRLEQALAVIRRAHGKDAVRPLGDTITTSQIPHLSTGFTLLDRAVGIGGLPRSHLTLLSGIPTSGAMTLACKVLAQAVDEATVCIDLPSTFDVDYAARCGVDPGNLLLIQPQTLEQGLETLTTLVDTASAAMLIFDENEPKRRVDTAVLNRLMSAIHRSYCALILVDHAGTALFSEKAAVRLHLQRERWLRQRRDIHGYRTQVQILKNQFGRSGQSVRLTIGFSTAVHGDGT